MFNCQAKILGSGTIKLSFKDGFIHYCFKAGPYSIGNTELNGLVYQETLEKETIEVEKYENMLNIRFSDYQVKIGLDPWSFSVIKEGKIIIQELPDDTEIGGKYITYPSDILMKIKPFLNVLMPLNITFRNVYMDLAKNLIP